MVNIYCAFIINHGEENDNLLQHSCLENPRNGGASWAAVCGVAQSRTRLKHLSSSSSIIKSTWLDVAHLPSALFSQRVSY